MAKLYPGRQGRNPGSAPEVVVVVISVAIAMVVVVAGVPVEFEPPFRMPEFARAPVVARYVEAHGSAEVAVVVAAVHITVTVVVAGPRIPVVTPFGMPILAGAPVVARDLADLSGRHSRRSYTGQSQTGRHDECCCCTACQCIHPVYDNIENCVPAIRLSPNRWQSGPKCGVSNEIGVVGPLGCGPL